MSSWFLNETAKKPLKFFENLSFHQNSQCLGSTTLYISGHYLTELWLRTKSSSIKYPSTIPLMVIDRNGTLSASFYVSTPEDNIECRQMKWRNNYHLCPNRRLFCRHYDHRHHHRRRRDTSCRHRQHCHWRRRHVVGIVTDFVIVIIVIIVVIEFSRHYVIIWLMYSHWNLENEAIF